MIPPPACHAVQRDINVTSQGYASPSARRAQVVGSPHLRWVRRSTNLNHRHRRILDCDIAGRSPGFTRRDTEVGG